MCLLYATSTPAKLSAMQSRLSGLNIELISLKDMAEQGFTIPKVPDELQPGVHVRTVNGRELDDDEMLEHYSSLARQYGDLTAKYQNAICLILDEGRIYESMDSSMESEKFIITSKPHSTIRKKGFPLDSLSVEIKTGKYYYDLPDEALEQFAIEDGFCDFFRSIIG